MLFDFYRCSLSFPITFHIFLLQASSDDETDNETIGEIQLLVQCLTIISRHFDNIGTIIKSSYISSCVAISNSIIDKVSVHKHDHIRPFLTNFVVF